MCTLAEFSTGALAGLPRLFEEEGVDDVSSVHPGVRTLKVKHYVQIFSFFYPPFHLNIKNAPPPTSSSGNYGRGLLHAYKKLL